MKLLVTIFILFGYIQSFGCSCDTTSFNQATEWADEIFIGRIIQLREVTKYRDDGDYYTRIWGALFEVEKKWKGSTKKYVEIFQSGTSCDLEFIFPSQPYIIYAKKEELIAWDSLQSFVGLGTWMCSRSADASIYNRWSEFGFDDRDRLDAKYPKVINLIGINFRWEWFLIGLVIFVIGIGVGFVLRNKTIRNLSGRG